MVLTGFVYICKHDSMCFAIPCFLARGSYTPKPETLKPKAISPAWNFKQNLVRNSDSRLGEVAIVSDLTGGLFLNNRGLLKKKRDCFL